MKRYNAKSLSIKELETRIRCTKGYINGLVAIRRGLYREKIFPKRLKMWLEPYTTELRRARYELKQYLQAIKEREK